MPVVYGAADYKDFAPPHSYINILDFPTIEKLVDYLKYLDSNDTAYNEYFAWVMNTLQFEYFHWPEPLTK